MSVNTGERKKLSSCWSSSELGVP